MEGGVHTAGSSSQITDGASAVMLANRGRVSSAWASSPGRASSTARSSAVDPETMLKGPIPATAKLLEAHRSLGIEDMDCLRGERGVRQRGPGLAEGGRARSPIA